MGEKTEMVTTEKYFFIENRKKILKRNFKLRFTNIKNIDC